MKNKVSNIQQKVVTRKPSVVARLWKFVQPYRRAMLMGFLILFFGGLLLSSWFSYRDWRQAKALKLFQTAKEEKDHEKVIQNYSGTRAAALSMIRLGEMRLEVGQFAQAAEIYERYLRIYPKSIFVPFIKNLLGECYLAEKRYSQAEQIFSQLLLEPQSAFLYTRIQMNLGRISVARGDFQKGFEIFERLEKDKPNRIWKDSIKGFLRSHQQANSDVQK